MQKMAINFFCFIFALTQHSNTDLCFNFILAIICTKKRKKFVSKVWGGDKDLLHRPLDIV